MTPEEMIEAYNVVAEDARQQTADAAGKIGNSQRSLGLMAERVASPSGQTSGLANYTYNRTLRPTVETTATALQAQGHAQALQKYLDDELRKAKNAYEDAQNAMTVAQSTPSSTSSSWGNNDNYEEGGADKYTDPVLETNGSYVAAPDENSTKDYQVISFTYELNGQKYSGRAYYNKKATSTVVQTPLGKVRVYQGAAGVDLPTGSYYGDAAGKALQDLLNKGAIIRDSTGNIITSINSFRFEK